MRTVFGIDVSKSSSEAAILVNGIIRDILSLMMPLAFLGASRSSTSR